MAVDHTASANWNGSLLEGAGAFSLGSGAATDVGITWKARAEDASAGTSPEELLAAALASCFSMALSAGLSRAGTPPTRIDTDATATFEVGEGGPRVSRIALRVRGQVDGLDEGGFREAAEGAKVNCPVSKSFAGNVEITLDAALA
jgi:lipoyl-dependent peroxiredoxin